MPRHFAILRVQKVKDWGAFDRRVRHCERTGDKPPANVDKERLKLNRRIFPTAPGAKAAKVRWRNRIGKQKVRRNAVLALEVFMGMSDDKVMSPEELRVWKARNLRWLRRTFGARNVIAGASNEDEKTPHLHAVVVPLDSRGKLNCRKILGDRGDMQKLQTEYAAAMTPFGLRRGVKGSKRKYVPQRRLYESRIEIEREVKQVEETINAQADKLKDFGTFAWSKNRKEIMDGVGKTMDDLFETLSSFAEVAKDVLLARRDAQEREQLIREKNEALATAQNQKERADDVLKSQAALVRGLDLVPIATEVLGLVPTEADGKFVFADDTTALEINGRKFRDARNPECRGTGAIDLVSKLTGRNFKGAVEYLLTRNKTDEIVADQTGAAMKAVQDQIRQVSPVPRILTLEDIPSRLWKPRPNAWPQARQHLISERQLDPQLLDRLHREHFIWAVDSRTIAFARRRLDQYPGQILGATLLRIDSPILAPRVLLPQQGGYFWAGEILPESDRAVVVANPIEALSYARLFKLNAQQNSPASSTASNSIPQIISVDSELPSTDLIRQVKLRAKRLVLATNTPLRQRALAKRLPEILDNDQFPEWLEFETAEPNVVDVKQSGAWNQLLSEKFDSLKNRSHNQPQKEHEQ